MKRLIKRKKSIKIFAVLFFGLLLIFSAAAFSGVYQRVRGGLSDGGLLAGDAQKQNDRYYGSRALEGSGRHAGKEEPDLPGRDVKDSLVVVDPGHGGEDYGTGAEGLDEKDVALDVSLKLGKLLEDSGIKVLYTRKTDEYIELSKRASIANDSGAALFISIHVNALENDTACNGSETLFRGQDENPDGGMDSERLAQIVQDELVSALGTKDNGIIERPRLAVLRQTNMPAVIAELGYVSNASDREKLNSEKYRQLAAEALLNASLKALNELHGSETE